MVTDPKPGDTKQRLLGELMSGADSSDDAEIRTGAVLEMFSGLECEEFSSWVIRFAESGEWDVMRCQLTLLEAPVFCSNDGTKRGFTGNFLQIIVFNVIKKVFMAQHSDMLEYLLGQETVVGWAAQQAVNSPKLLEIVCGSTGKLNPAQLECVDVLLSHHGFTGTPKQGVPKAIRLPPSAPPGISTTMAWRQAIVALVNPKGKADAAKILQKIEQQQARGLLGQDSTATFSMALSFAASVKKWDLVELLLSPKGKAQRLL
eukprot:comp24285_c0_seq1/m.45395 comp24285_c0_seq1/g.45395  ORF comp24285_c0_seq1/g.45395 comp24285_c0_seq1/m.45395 type:complete len:260 (-) comp24285_c0_seq1:1721-2500(-)